MAHKQPRNTYELVTHLIRRQALRMPQLVQAFLATDRARFVPSDKAPHAYEDHPIKIGHGQTISQPFTVALMLEMLEAMPGHRVLDIGSGSGFSTVLIGRLVGEQGEVIGLERIPELLEMGRANAATYGLPQVRFEPASPAVLGIEGEQFDRITVSAAAKKMPQALVDQLKIGGRIVIPIEGSLVAAIKDEQGKLHTRSVDGFRFVPLVEPLTALSVFPPSA